MSELHDAPDPSRETAWAQVERIVDQFEQTWQGGQRPVLDDYLAGAESVRPVLLVELIRADMELRIQAGEAARVEEYLTRYPELALQPGALSTLIRWEYHLCSPSEPGLSPTGYAARSPNHAIDWGSFTPAVPDRDRTEDRAIPLPSIPGYEILQVIGKGGMGVVYKAKQLALGRVVALKMILASPFTSSEERQRFLTEAYTMARLSHPNIVQLFEIDECRGHPYLVLEYVENGTLAQRLKRQPLPPREAASLTAVLARAIHAAHSVGIVHRDLKPDNILLTAEETPKISDFGLAKYLDEAVTRTHSGAILGTPAYMAPEQAAGQTQSIGPAADIHALGTILYELLTGGVPFPGATRESVLRKVLHDEPTPPRRLRPQLPRGLQNICLKCLEKSPPRRYGTARELAEDLERFLAGKPPQARRSSAWQGMLKGARRRPALAGLFGVTLLALLVVLGIWVVLPPHLQNAPNEPEEPTGQEHQEKVIEEVRRSRYAMAIRHAADLRQHGEITQCFDYLRARQTAAEEDLRGFEWGYLRRWSSSSPLILQGPDVNGFQVRYHPDGKRLAAGLGMHAIGLWDVQHGTPCGAFRGHTGEVSAFAFSPDGHTLASASLDGTLRLWNVADQGPRAILIEHGGAFGAVEFSPSGRYLAFVTDWGEKVGLWDLRAGHLRHTWHYPAGSGGFIYLGFTPDDRTLMAGYRLGVAKLWEVDSGRETGSCLFDQPLRSVAFAPQGPLFAVGLESGEVSLWDAEARARVATIARHDKPVRCLTFSPDNRVLLFVGDDGTLHLWDLTNQRQRGIFRYPLWYPTRVAFSPNGKAFAVGCYRGPVRLWNTEDLPSLGDDSLADDVTPAGPVAFSPDGKRLAVAGMDRAVHLMDLQSGQVLRSLRAGHGSWQDLTFSPDGRSLAAAGEDHRVHVWDVDTGVQTADLLGHQDVVSGVAYSPDGKWLVSGGADGRLVIWAMPTGEKRSTLREHEAAVTGVAFHPDGTCMASTSLDKTVRLWDVPSFARRDCVSYTEELYGGVFSPDGRLFLANSKTRGPISWDVLGRGRLGAAKEFNTGPTRSLTVFPDSRLLAVSTEVEIQLYDIPSRRERWSINRKGSGGCRLAASRDGKRLVASKRGGPLAVWDVPHGEKESLPDFMRCFQVREWPHTPPPPIYSLAFTPDCNRLITASGDLHDTSVRTHRGLLGEVHDQAPVKRIADQVRCWSLPAEQPCRPLIDAPTLSQHAVVALSPDGNTLALGGNDGTVSLWGLDSGKLHNRLLVSRHGKTNYPRMEWMLSHALAYGPQYDHDHIMALSFSPDGRLLAVASEDKFITLWETSTGREVLALPGHDVDTSCLAFSPDGRLLATRDGKVLALWDVSRLPRPPQLQRSMQGHSQNITSVAFSRDGRFLASGAVDSDIRLWDVGSGREVKRLQGHSDWVIALAFSPDGRTLASGGSDGTVCLWQVATGQQLMTLTHEAHHIHALAFSSDGQALAAGGEGANGRGKVWVWRSSTP